MSEYQYYEFLAVDRPLTDEEYEQVRALSTRAQISRTRFVNEYEWGDFKGDPAALMDRFYDAHLYFANWGTRILMFRLPLTLLGMDAAEDYCNDCTVFVRRSGENVVLDLRSEDDEGDAWWEDDGPGSLATLIALRSELAAGDLRPLYLAWLAGLGSAETPWAEDEDDDCLEPPVPSGLSRLTTAQRALADFLRVDRDLLAAAAEGSSTVGIPQASLFRSAAVRVDARRNALHEQEAKQREERELQARRSQDQRLAELAASGERAWQQVNALVAAKNAASYDAAARLLADLDALSRRGGSENAYARRLAELRSTHQRKSAFIARLDEAGPA